MEHLESLERFTLRLSWQVPRDQNLSVGTGLTAGSRAERGFPAYLRLYERHAYLNPVSCGTTGGHREAPVPDLPMSGTPSLRLEVRFSCSVSSTPCSARLERPYDAVRIAECHKTRSRSQIRRDVLARMCPRFRSDSRSEALGRATVPIQPRTYRWQGPSLALSAKPQERVEGLHGGTLRRQARIRSAADSARVECLLRRPQYQPHE